MAAEESGERGRGGWGGRRREFLQKVRQRERGPFRRRDRRDGREEGNGGGETGVASERTRARGGDGGRGRTTSAMIRQKIRCTAIGCSQFELLASPVAVRQSLPDLLDTLVPSLSVSLLRSLPFPYPIRSPLAHPCLACAAAAAAAAAAVSSVEPPFSGEWAPARRAEKTSKKKSNFVAMVTGVR